jgi:hypothetical protein
MVSFYGFYTTFTIIVSIASIVSLGFLINKYKTTADDSCNVDQYKLNYNLYKLTLFLLIGVIFKGILNTLGYCCTRYNENTPGRAFIIFLMVVIFIVQCLGSLLMLHVFSTNHQCFSFYENNNLCLLISYISVNVIFILEAFFVIIAVITKLFCTETKYNKFSNDYYA